MTFIGQASVHILTTGSRVEAGLRRVRHSVLVIGIRLRGWRRTSQLDPGTSHKLVEVGDGGDSAWSINLT